MRIATVFAVVLVSGALSSIAQKPATFTGQASFVASRPSDCPIDMRVRQGIGGQLREASKDGARAETFAARLRLLLNDARLSDGNSARMVKATVTVHGTNDNGRMMPAKAVPNRSFEIEKTLTVRLSADGGPEVAGNLVLPGFTSAGLVDLISVTYDDGTVRKFSAPGSCRAVTEGLMEISAR
ncbi:MAG TPA: hypothetical protein VGG85_18180 [Terracidiphilus sp.]|jgi:hypothetical protein